MPTLRCVLQARVQLLKSLVSSSLLRLQLFWQNSLIWGTAAEAVLLSVIAFGVVLGSFSRELLSGLEPDSGYSLLLEKGIPCTGRQTAV